ncbi:hypothetical protein CHU98_g1265 [Xylaria longipes]|nr:hypothetical protein CHU98_g1265 [Xylaria longipes]
MAFRLPQPDYNVISNKVGSITQDCAELGKQFVLFQNIPAVAGGNAILDSLERLKQDMTTGFDLLRQEMNRGFALVRSDINKLKTDVAELKTDVAKLKADVAELKTNVRGLKDDVAELKADVAKLKADVAELKTNVKGLKDDVRGLKDDVRGLKDDVRGLKDDVAELKTNVQGLTTRTTSLEAHIELNNVARLWNGLATDLALPIRPLYSPLTHEVIADFPATRADFDTLNQPRLRSSYD